MIDNGLADVVTNSWGDTAGDLFDDAATRPRSTTCSCSRTPTGITVQFSSGDDGDNFEIVGVSRAADYPT